jgi:hypothetical protein
VVTTPTASALDWEAIVSAPNWWEAYVESPEPTPAIVVEAPLPVESWVDIPVVSEPSYPQSWQTNWDHSTVSEPTNFNSIYKAMSTSDTAYRQNSLNHNQLYDHMGMSPLKRDPSRADIESRYGKQLPTDSVYMNPGKPKGMSKQGPAIYSGGRFRKTEPSIINAPLTGRPVVAYDFHGVIQNCPGPNMPCTVMTSVVDQLIEDSKTNDIIIVTAGVPEGNDDIVDYLKNQAGVWHLVKHLYNSGSKWEVMADLSVIRHYDDLMDNLRRINSRVTGLALVHVEPRTEAMTVYIA